MILYVNSCIRENSRTDKLARALLDKLGDYDELVLKKSAIKPLDMERLERRAAMLEKGNFADASFLLAKQFAQADTIVISAPYWDTSFPSLLKIYLENIYVMGIVSEYGADGIPRGLCQAGKLYYVTTAGGAYEPEYSYGYIRTLALNRFGIKETKLIYAEYLDIEGNNPEEILRKAIAQIEV